MLGHKLKIILHTPQIPPNTGCIARTCAANNVGLHLIKPIGFDLSDKAVKRAGLDYWHLVDLTIHETWDEFLVYKSQRPGRVLAFSPAGVVRYDMFEYRDDDWILHGQEATGLPLEILRSSDNVLYIPMQNPGVRSLNLAVSAGLSVYQAFNRLNI
ncbi:hypothetical protein SteCoe_5734 [Stentor coeruleus]|uniref:tRNA/rRNA methyltransferase SpoU type domain-containing protein n=1 Tax=Stentor coeruleus TaxID=5963 RepID=A0A1R2CRR5_9CILI|nr:hypothetical protein SteCoe_5734 [Stentor coeruleus]